MRPRSMISAGNPLKSQLNRSALKSLVPSLLSKKNSLDAVEPSQLVCSLSLETVKVPKLSTSCVCISDLSMQAATLFSLLSSRSSACSTCSGFMTEVSPCNTSNTACWSSVMCFSRALFRSCNSRTVEAAAALYFNEPCNSKM